MVLVSRPPSMAPADVPVLTESRVDRADRVGRVGQWVAIAVVIAGMLVIAGGLVAFVRWDDIKAWADAPEVLRVNTAALDVALPPGSTEDPTRSACAMTGALRCAWTTQSPRDAVTDLADGLRALDVEVDAVLCDDPALPSGPQDGELACGVRIAAADEELWILATDRTPSGGVPLTRTAVWFAWDTIDMSSPLYERVVAADPYPYPSTDDGEPHLASSSAVEDALPARYAGITQHCWQGPPVGGAPCTSWEAPIDTGGLPADGQVEALVRELADAGFFVDGADPSLAGAPLIAHRFTVPGGVTGVEVYVRMEGGELVARVLAL